MAGEGSGKDACGGRTLSAGLCPALGFALVRAGTERLPRSGAPRTIDEIMVHWSHGQYQFCPSAGPGTGPGMLVLVLVVTLSLAWLLLVVAAF